MSTSGAMLESYPASLGGVDRDALRRCIDECVRCAQACTACADACLSETEVADLRKCIRTNLDCADICDTTGRVLSRHTEYDANITGAQLQASLQDLRRHLRAPRQADGTLQDLRGGVPQLRTSLRCLDQCLRLNLVRSAVVRGASPAGRRPRPIGHRLLAPRGRIRYHLEHP